MKTLNRILYFAGIMLVSSAPIRALNEAYTGDVLINNELQYTCKGEVLENSQTASKTHQFYDKLGHTIISENVSYESNSFKPIEMKVTDLQTGRLEEIYQTKQGYKLCYRARSDDPIQEKIIPYNGTTLHGSYVPMYISKKMDRIVKEEILTFQLLVVDKLSSYEFQVRQNGIKTINGKDYLEIILEPTSWIVKQFVSSISFYYSPDNYPKIVRYRGNIGPRDANGNIQTGEIIFHYPSD